MTDRSLTTRPADDREALVLRYWRRGDITPLHLANALARGVSPAELAPPHDESRHAAR